MLKVVNKNNGSNNVHHVCPSARRGWACSPVWSRKLRQSLPATSELLHLPMIQYSWASQSSCKFLAGQYRVQVSPYPQAMLSLPLPWWQNHQDKLIQSAHPLQKGIDQKHSIPLQQLLPGLRNICSISCGFISLWDTWCSLLGVKRHWGYGVVLQRYVGCKTEKII